MAFGLKKEEIQILAEGKLQDAILLVSNNRFSSAYYFAGYSVELAIKACIAGQMIAGVIPDKAFVNSIYKHDLKSLISTAGLSAALKAAEDANPNFAANWAIVSEWDNEVRYEAVEAISAQLLISAITDQQSGVLQWIKAYW